MSSECDRGADYEVHRISARLGIGRKLKTRGRNSGQSRNLPTDARRGHDQVQPQVLQRHRSHQLHQ